MNRTEVSYMAGNRQEHSMLHNWWDSQSLV